MNIYRVKELLYWLRGRGYGTKAPTTPTVRNNLYNPSLWTDVETQILKDLWGTGVTAREIGAILKRSKGSVIGRANRIGISKTAPKKLSLISVEPAPKGKITTGCQFPLGEPPYSWCGADIMRGASTDVYCEAHYKKCYRERIGVSDKFELGPGEFRDVKTYVARLRRKVGGRSKIKPKQTRS